MHTTTRKRNNVIEVNSLIGQDRLFADIAKQPVSLKNGSKVYLLYSRGSLLTCIAFEHVDTNSQRILAIPCPLSLIYFLAIFRVKPSLPASFTLPGSPFITLCPFLHAFITMPVMSIFTVFTQGEFAQMFLSRTLWANFEEGQLCYRLRHGRIAFLFLASQSRPCSTFCAYLIGIVTFAVISVAMFSVVTFTITGAFCFPLLLGSVIYFTHDTGPSVSSRRGMFRASLRHTFICSKYTINPPHKQYQEVSLCSH